MLDPPMILNVKTIKCIFYKLKYLILLYNILINKNYCIDVIAYNVKLTRLNT